MTGSSYLPSGPLTGLSLDNGLSVSRDFDSRYRPSRIHVPGRLDWQFTTDAVGNVTAIVDAIDPVRGRSKPPR